MKVEIEIKVRVNREMTPEEYESLHAMLANQTSADAKKMLAEVADLEGAQTDLRVTKLGD